MREFILFYTNCVFREKDFFYFDIALIFDTMWVVQGSVYFLVFS